MSDDTLDPKAAPGTEGASNTLDASAVELINKQKVVAALLANAVYISPLTMIVLCSALDNEEVTAPLPISHRFAKAQMVGQHLHVYDADGEEHCTGDVGASAYLADVARIVNCEELDADGAAYFSALAMTYVTPPEVVADDRWQAARRNTADAIRQLKNASGIDELKSTFQSFVERVKQEEADSDGESAPITVIPTGKLAIC
jgi:hypothetical protein